MTTRFWISWLFDFGFEQQWVLKKKPGKIGCFAGFEFCDGGWRAEWSKTQALTAKRCLFCKFGFNLLKVGAFWLATAEAFCGSEIHRNISVSKAVLAEWRWKRCFHYAASHCGPWSEHIFETQILKCPDIKIIAWDDHPTLSMFGRLRKKSNKGFRLRFYLVDRKIWLGSENVQ